MALADDSPHTGVERATGGFVLALFVAALLLLAYLVVQILRTGPDEAAPGTTAPGTTSWVAPDGLSSLASARLA